MLELFCPTVTCLTVLCVFASRTVTKVSSPWVTRTYLPSGDQALVTGPLPSGSVSLISSVCGSRTLFVFAPLACTHSSLPSGEMRSMYGLLPLGKYRHFASC